MKISFKSLVYLMAAGTLTITACNNSTDSSSSSTDTSKMTQGSAGDTAGSMTNNTTANNSNPDQDCINFLVPANETEMAWLQAGINNGGAEVKSHAKSMLADHKAMGEKVKALIAQKGLTTPAVDTTGAVSLMDKKGKEWDKAWNDKMVADHADLLSHLNSAETSVKDADLKMLLTNSKPVVQKHLDMAKMMQGKM